MDPLPGSFSEKPVAAFLPKENLSFCVNEGEFILERAVGTEASAPVREAAVIQDVGLFPSVQAGKNCDTLSAPDRRGAYGEKDVSVPWDIIVFAGTEGPAVLSSENDFIESGRPEGGIRRTVQPTVLYKKNRRFLRSGEAVGAPFATECLPVFNEEIGIVGSPPEFPAGKRSLPDASGKIFHIIYFLPDAELEFLSPGSLVTK